jgi:hypothetical protein
MDAMNIGEPNKKMGVPEAAMIPRQMKKLQKTRNGRKILTKTLSEDKNIPGWRRVLYGDLQKAGFQAQMMRGMRLAIARGKGE